jgi:hypothetical protein
MSQATVSEHEGAEYGECGGESNFRLSVCRKENRKSWRYATIERTSKNNQTSEEGESRGEKKAAYLHGPRQLKDDGPRNPNCLDPPDLDHQARKM